MVSMKTRKIASSVGVLIGISAAIAFGAVLGNILAAIFAGIKTLLSACVFIMHWRHSKVQVSGAWKNYKPLLGLWYSIAIIFGATTLLCALTFIISPANAGAPLDAQSEYLAGIMAILGAGWSVSMSLYAEQYANEAAAAATESTADLGETEAEAADEAAAFALSRSIVSGLPRE